jgi:two-component system response regulator YesN
MVSFLQKKVSDLYGITITIVLLSKSSFLPQLGELYYLSKNALDLRFYLGKGTIIQSTYADDDFTNNDILLPEFKKALLDAIKFTNKKEAVDILENYYNSISEIRLSQNTAQISSLNLIATVYENFFKQNENLDLTSNKSQPPDIIMFHDTLQGIRDYIIGIVSSLIDYLIGKHTDKNKYIIERVFKIIEESYHKPITVEDISREVYLSPNYLRTVFKEKTGETILGYLTHFRMDRAAELLKDGSKKVHEVAISVGYENVSYFCSIFSKYKGITPNEYRKNFL